MAGWGLVGFTHPTGACRFFLSAVHCFLTGTLNQYGYKSLTSEVCIMNSVAAVLAADSATTVQYYGKEGIEQRYFKGANKIFQLSHKHPVGLMIYNSASLLNVPWEVTIKEFRRSLGEKSFNTIEGFAEEFFDFIQSNTRFFPEDVRRADFVRFCESTAVQKALLLRKKLADDSSQSVENLVNDYIASTKDCTDAPFEPSEISDLMQACITDLVDHLDEVLGILKLEISSETLREFADRIFHESLEKHGNDENYTGMIFAGFGDHSIFPEMVCFDRCEFWGTKFSARDKEENSVSHTQPAVINGFAQTSMVDTFVSGISFEAFAKMHNFMVEEMNAIGGAFSEACNGKSVSFDLEDEIRRRADSFRSKLFDYMRTDHDDPLRRVIGFLPVEEMAELAETLINLQSLKEKVTKPSETVGGPVDVAAITRSEGLVWIKRKHFFDAAKNSRYFSRQQG